MSQDLGQVLGIKLSLLAAGFAGGVVSLSYLKSLSPTSAMSAVVSGALSSAYLTEPALLYLNIQNAPLHVENGMAFFIGLAGMHIIPALLNLAERFKNNANPTPPPEQKKEQHHDKS